MIDAYCGNSTESVFGELLEMLVFDALIGSMDRHAMNWGVLRSQFSDAPSYRLAPIFDSARALLWDLPEAKLLRLDLDEVALLQYVSSARPCIGPPPGHPKVNSCNHFEFLTSLLNLYEHQTRTVYDKIDVDICTIGAKLLNQFPFVRAFSSLRRRVILKILRVRADKIRAIFEEGGADDHSQTAALGH